jgi:co-chaperonin GroES (HSP10)
MIKPIKNNVLVKPFLTKEKTESGIFIPESCRTETDRVEIVAVGDGTKDKKMYFKPGQIGYRVKDWGTPVKDGEITYYLMDASAILCLE